MKFQLIKTLQLRRRESTDWESEQEIAGFREDGIDLVILDRDNREIARYQASDYEEWIVKGYIKLTN